MKRNFLKQGFTLAEILIALTIIGVIAAVTMPVLIGNSQDKELAAGLKKNYSVFKQVLTHYYADTGEMLTQSTENTAADSKRIKEALIKYVSNIKDCGYGWESYDAANNTQSCIPFGKFGSIYKTYNGNNLGGSAGAFDQGQFVLSDGTAVFLNADSPHGTLISVDVNGFEKKPNRLGKDLFVFQLTQDGDLLPGGAAGTWYSDENTYCSNTSTNTKNGAGCAAKVLQEQ